MTKVERYECDNCRFVDEDDAIHMRLCDGLYKSHIMRIEDTHGWCTVCGKLFKECEGQ